MSYALSVCSVGRGGGWRGKGGRVANWPMAFKIRAYLWLRRGNRPPSRRERGAHMDSMWVRPVQPMWPQATWAKALSTGSDQSIGKDEAILCWSWVWRARPLASQPVWCLRLQPILILHPAYPRRPWGRNRVKGISAVGLPARLKS